MILGSTFLVGNSDNVFSDKVTNPNNAKNANDGNDNNVANFSGDGLIMQDVAIQIKGLLNNSVNGSDSDCDKARQKYLEKINARLQSGKPLTPKQIAYLQKNEPLLYLYAKIIEIKRKSVESQLRNCRSKEEAQRIQEFSINSIGKNNPIKEKLINAVNYTIEEFKKTDSYKNLPATDKEANCHKDDHVNQLKTDKDKQNDESDDNADEGNGLPVQYDIALGKYQEAYVCKTNEFESSFSSIQC